jgi:WD40 repeat protein
VRVIRQSPKDNDQIAVGLENGEVKLWDISTNKQRQSLSQNKGDRVFDVVFSQNGRYLYSGHGSGLVNQWNLENSNKQKSINVKFTVYALAYHESSPDPPLVFIAGRFNKLAVWDGNNQDFYELPYQWKDWNHKKLKPVFGQHHYITSLATANNILASADNQGYITLWDIAQIRECINNQTELCDEAILAQRRDGHGNQPVRSVALTSNVRYLASAGDDGRVMLWSLTKDKEPEKWLEEGKMIGQSDARLNSVDIKALSDYVLVTSGDDHYQVNLYRETQKWSERK